MTAQIVDHVERTSYEPEPEPVGAIDWTPEQRERYGAWGQLWERLAEVDIDKELNRKLTHGEWTLRRVRELKRRIVKGWQTAHKTHGGSIHDRGPKVRGHSIRPQASGVIVAGVLR